MPAVRVNSASVLVVPDAVLERVAVGLALYARVSSHHQRSNLDRQVARLTNRAAAARHKVVRG